MLERVRIIRNPTGTFTVYACFGEPDPHNARLHFKDAAALAVWVLKWIAR